MKTAVTGRLARVELGGYIYALKFSNGMVKVGKSCDPLQRLEDHCRAMRRAGGHLRDWWFSKPHAYYDATEVFVVEAATALMTPESGRSGFEWFYNIDYNALIFQIQELAPCSRKCDIFGNDVEFGAA